MQQTFHPLSELFRQLGLPDDAASIEAFVQTHAPLPAGVALADAPAYSFQGHPEASPGPHDMAGLFDRFIAMMAH